MNFKGHTKIELFDAKTKELVECVEDDNLFTNALDSILNDNLGGMLVGTQSTSNNNMIFPLPEYALGGLMLLPEAEPESKNNLYPHHYPTAVGVYGRTDIAGNHRMGIYNETESGEIEGGYKHVWEYTTEQGNGTIACAALTHKYAVDTTVYSGSDVKPYRPFLALTSHMDPNSTSYITDDNLARTRNCTPLGVYNGKLCYLAIATEIMNDEATPSFNIIETNYVVTKCNKLSDRRLDVTDYLTDTTRWKIVGTFTLPIAYSDTIVFQAFPKSSTEAVLLISKAGVLWRQDGGAYITLLANTYVDVYIIDMSQLTATFIRTINYPVLQTDGTAIIEETGRDLQRNQCEQGQWWESFSGTDYHLCCELTNAYGNTENHSNWYNRFNQNAIMCTRGNSFLDYPYLIYKPSWFVGGRTSYSYLKKDLLIKMNLLTNEFTLFDVGESTSEYWMARLYPGRGTIACNTKIFESETDAIKQTELYFRSIWNQDIPDTFVDTFIGYIYTNGVVMLSRTGNIGSTYMGVYTNVCINTQYLATINNLPTPITKTKDQTMKVTYTIYDAE